MTSAYLSLPSKVVGRGIELCEEVAGLFEAASEALTVDMKQLLKQMEPLPTPLDQYALNIGRFKAAAMAADSAAPNEVRR